MINSLDLFLKRRCLRLMALINSYTCINESKTKLTLLKVLILAKKPYRWAISQLRKLFIWHSAARLHLYHIQCATSSRKYFALKASCFGFSSIQSMRRPRRNPIFSNKLARRRALRCSFFSGIPTFVCFTMIKFLDTRNFSTCTAVAIYRFWRFSIYRVLMWNTSPFCAEIPWHYSFRKVSSTVPVSSCFVSQFRTLISTNILKLQPKTLSYLAHLQPQEAHQHSKREVEK